MFKLNVFSNLRDKGVGGDQNYEAFLYRPPRGEIFTAANLREKGVIGANDAEPLVGFLPHATEVIILGTKGSLLFSLARSLQPLIE